MCNTMNYSSAKALFLKYQIELSISKYDKLAQFAALMIRESRIQNITAITDLQDIWIRHFLDSAYLCRYLPQDSISVIDIGTGGGIPGIPLAILLDHAKVTLLDSELRKIEFCQKCAEVLQINVKCISGRAEEMAKLSAYREQFDFAVSRAMTSGSILTEMSIPFLRIHGKLLAMKGKQFDDSVEHFDSACKTLHSKIASINRYAIEGEDKNLIVVDKLEKTPDVYPRRFAKIKRNPL